MVRHGQALHQGKSIEKPTCDLTLGNRATQTHTLTMKPASVIVIQGFILFNSPFLIAPCAYLIRARGRFGINFFHGCD